ncbi:DUF551 domain-containing protein [Escherichia coli]
MTTNNHPAHGPVSLERLHQISEILSKAAAQSDGGNLGYAMADAVKVIDGAIAARNAEPVAIVQPSDYVTAAELVGEEQTRKAVHELYEGALRIGDKLYRHPQEWQSKQMSCPKCNDTGMADSGGVQPWGEPILIECDCRAAMLQDGSYPVTPDGWIPVSERMPEKGQEIIVMDVTRGKVQSGMIYKNGRFVDFNEEYYEVKSPSHWMPMPAAPRQE